MFRHELVFFARSDEVFAHPSGVVNPAHCLTRNDVLPPKPLKTMIYYAIGKVYTTKRSVLKNREQI